MPVEVHRVDDWKIVANNDTNRRLLAKVVDVPLGIGWIGDIALVRQKEDWVAGFI